MDGEDHDSRSDGGDEIDESDCSDGPVAAPALADTGVNIANSLAMRSPKATARKQAPLEEWPRQSPLDRFEARPVLIHLGSRGGSKTKSKHDPSERRTKVDKAKKKKKKKKKGEERSCQTDRGL